MMCENFLNNSDNLMLDELLDNNYSEILKAIKKEGYNLDFLEYDVFQEITFENQVVGFMSFKKLPLIKNHYAIMETYIIPEFRGNNLLFKSLLSLCLLDNYEFFPRKPTRAFINVLLKNDFAMELDSDFIISYFKFIVDVCHEIYKNPSIKRFYKKPAKPIQYKANLFDWELCSVMFTDSFLDLIKNHDFFALTEPRKYDFKKHNCRKKLKKVNKKYIDEKYSIWDDNEVEIDEFRIKKDMELHELFSIDNMVGSEDKLSDDFIVKLSKFNLSKEDGFKIREHIVNKMELGQLNGKSYYQRVLYLLNYFENIEKETKDYDESAKCCPFCRRPIPDYARSCLHCGLHIRDLDFEEFVVENSDSTEDKENI